MRSRIAHPIVRTVEPPGPDGSTIRTIGEYDWATIMKKGEFDVEQIPAQFSSLIIDVKSIIQQGRTTAYDAVNKAMVMTYWCIGKRIVEEEQHGNARAEYGKQLIAMLANELIREYGKGFSARNLANFRKFYLCFKDEQILQTRLQNLSWSHFCALLRVDDEATRLWYLREAAEECWSVRVLDRNIGTQYYYRLLQSPSKDKVVAEMQHKTKDDKPVAAELIKNPVIAEFLGFRAEDSFAENELESAILSHIRDFLIELGRGFAFVGRQQHIITDTQDYYIDLVFYNIELKCYVLIDLKMGTVTH